ncbi:hypothetical protein O6H91_13G038900 [Diphasiastrum complanatum]|uniref:Uncharacterized protein n=1 Tax=Diphasiastrum complanatum TaxID=34168 RepID=A0ACC2BU27_DIPCM|nr:hypothetical protein O6H91_13G038900 [Diphasiastrum complanatum]
MGFSYISLHLLLLKKEKRSRRMEASYLLICVLIFYSLVRNVSAVSSDGEALLSMRSQIIDESRSLNNWQQTDSTPCSWSGISCDEFNNVVSLDLGNMNLSGTLAADIGRLESLVNVSLVLNNFTGNLPFEISNLNKLRCLNVSHNNFSNAFPANFSRLLYLEVLDAYNNNFSGPLPLELGSLPRLRHFHLGGSYFDGPIPPEFGNLRHLRYMALSGNSLTGKIPAEIGNLTQLQFLYLGYFNAYDGGIPPELGKLRNLIRLDLAFCNLTGSLPKELKNLTNLDSLFLQINALTGSIPPEYGDLVSLKSLDLSNNQLSGEIPQDLQKLQKLELISFFRNQLHGHIPSSIADLPNLQVLFLWANNLTGNIPLHLGRNGNLYNLDLSSNALNGSIPPNLCYGGNLEILILLNNQLSGFIPESLGACESLVHVRLGVNELSGPIPLGLLSLKRMQMLELVNNQLSGGIPDIVGAPILEFLDISENHLTGSIPENVSNLFKLKKLLLNDNNLSGAIPLSIGKLEQLGTLDLRGNALASQIPADIGNCKSLSSLDLSGNQLTGAIPAQLGKIEVLDVLNLSRNHLTGRIPPELENIVSLTAVDFSYNSLSGPIPLHGQFQYFNSTSFVGNQGLCGAELIPCILIAPPPIAPRLKNETQLLPWLVGALFLAAVLVLIGGICCFFQKYKLYIHELLYRDKSARPWKLTAFQRLDFNSSQILECLIEENIIGRGASGVVYKGMMPSGEIVAVKRLSPQGKKGVSHDHGFSAETRTLGKIRHRNIVKLLGCCSNHETNLLLYEYMPNGSLGELLHDKKGKALDWATRYKISVQAANGLCYLHHDCSPLIVHRDVKSNNILLDVNFEAHVADFGLAKLFHDSQSMSSIAGSYGYIAPEYAYTLKVNEKSDIYSFGVVLLELVTGRRPIEPAFGDGVDVVQWVRRKIQTKEGVLDVLDPRMGSAQTLPLHEVMLVLRVALLCSSDLPVDRPAMRDVVQMLSDVKCKGADAKLELSTDLEQEGLLKV